MVGRTLSSESKLLSLGPGSTHFGRGAFHSWLNFSAFCTLLTKQNLICFASAMSC